jgi:hypothetical protein
MHKQVISSLHSFQEIIRQLVVSSKLLNGFRLNLVLTAYTKCCRSILILASIGLVSAALSQVS